MKAAPPSVENVLNLPALLTESIPEQWEDENGHLNIQHYMALFMKGSRPMMRDLSMDDKYFEERRCGVFDLEHHLRYLAEIYSGETVSVRARLLANNAKRLHGIMFLVNQTRRQLASTMEFVSSGADLDTRRTRPFPDDVVKALDDMIREHAQLDWEPPVCGVISV